MKTQVTMLLDQLMLWAFQVMIGVGTKLAIESRTRIITKKYVFTSFIIASFIGYITDRLCTKWGMQDMRGVAVSVMALLSETILRYLLENSNSILNAIVRRQFNIDVAKEGKDVTSIKTEEKVEIKAVAISTKTETLQNKIEETSGYKTNN